MIAAINRRATAAWVIAAALGLSVVSAHAGPCSTDIAQFEQAVRQSAGNPNAGPLAPQSIGREQRSRRPWRAPRGSMPEAIAQAARAR
jgi:hypothetical protein